ncbi:MAG: GntR family transcriptional regulator [Chitinivibrionales bacterium]|nr:GntR family transcriptional regulator [Chitinivibrionales bacterium]
MRSPSSRSRAQAVAERLEQEIEHSTITRLPSMRTLAQRYGVSVTTVHKAVGVLRERGVVDTCRGGRTLVRARQSAVQVPLRESPPPDTITHVYTRLRERINDGTFRMGHPLPKVAYLASELHVSHHTVTAAYRRLKEENLVHKEGRSWVTGPLIVRSPSAEFVSQPVIILLESREDFWADMAQRPFFESFCRAFQTEVEAYNVQLVPALFERRGTMPHVAPAGRSEVFSLIRSLGHRYRGCLLANSSNEVDGLRAWMTDLLAYGRPVVWFDRLKENPRLSFSSPQFSRCHESEARAVRLALDHLSSIGHAHAAFACFADEHWSARRAGIIRDAIRSVRRGISVELSRDTDDIFNTADIPTQVRLLKRWYHSLPVVRSAVDTLVERSDELFDMVGERVVDKLKRDRFEGTARLLAAMPPVEKRATKAFRELDYLRWLIHVTPLLCRALADPRVTALVAPNDTYAHYFCSWLRAGGTAIPEQISVISFDNLWFLQHLSVTSVDFGYGYLGFAAFHSIIQDIAIDKDRQGNIAARPRIVFRGTVAPPKHPLDREPFAALCATIDACVG